MFTQISAKLLTLFHTAEPTGKIWIGCVIREMGRKLANRVLSKSGDEGFLLRWTEML